MDAPSTDRGIIHIGRTTGMRYLPLVGIMIFFLYMGWVLTKTEMVFWSLDEAGKFINLQSILQSGQINTPLLYPGRNFDPGNNFIPLYYSISRGNDIFSWWPVNLPLVTLPFYAVFGWIGLFILPAAAGAATTVLSALIAWKLTASQKAAILTGLLTGLATPVTFYSTMYWEHTIAAAFSLATLYLILYSLSSENRIACLFAGILASLSIFFRLDTAPILIGFGLILLVKNWKLAGIFAITTALASLPWMALNHWVSGHPFGPTFANIETSEPFIGLSQAGLKFIPFALFNPPRIDGYIFSRPMLLGASLLLLIGLLFLFIRPFWVSILSFGGVAAISAWVLLQPTQYQAVHGFVLIAPQILFGLLLFCKKQNWSRYSYTWFLFSAILCYAAAYVWFGWVAAGGLQWGPRYLLTFYPLLIIAAIVAVIDAQESGAKPLKQMVVIVFAASCLIGFGYQIRGLITARNLIEMRTVGSDALLTLKDAPVIASEVFTMNNPRLYWTGNIFKPPRSDEQWLAWTDLVKRNGYTYYYLVDAFTVSNAPVNEIAHQLKVHPEGLIVDKIYITP